MITVKRFTSTWCQPCKQLAPLFEQLRSEYPNVSFQTIDVDMDGDTTMSYGITSVPTVIIESNGQVVLRSAGVQPKSTYTNIIKSLN
jgi:thioredoxin 1